MAGANLVEFTTDNWQQEVVQSDKPVVVDFWAPWCGPCRQLSPIIDRLATQFAGKVKVGKLNTDDHQDVAVRYGINAIPQVFIFGGGSDQPAQRLVGFTPEAELVKVINKVLGA
jgi:thioredoxin 1